MSWETLLVLAFLALPILQGILEQRKQDGKAPPKKLPSTPEEWEAWVQETRQRRQRVRPPPAEAPPPIPVAVADGRVVLVGEPRPRPSDPPALETVSLETAPARSRLVEIPVDEVMPDREAEHERFHRKLVESSAAGVGHAESRLRLRDRDELRRALVLAEVLGPPRALG